MSIGVQVQLPKLYKMPNEYGYETPYTKERASLEYQIIVFHLLFLLQWDTLGPQKPKHFANEILRKSVWKNLKNLEFPILEKLLKKSKVKKRPIDEEEYDKWLFDYLENNWNAIYNETLETGTLLGYLSGYLSGNLKLPQNRINQMSIADYDIAFKHKVGVGLDYEKLREALGKDSLDKQRFHAIDYANNKGAKWIAVYDEHGERQGRPYEIISKLYKKQISTSLENNETLEELQSRMAYPNILDALEKGEITEDEYLEYTNEHLNRDFRRFALTESTYAWQNGKLLEMADRQKSTNVTQYLEFVTH